MRKQLLRIVLLCCALAALLTISAVATDVYAILYEDGTMVFQYGNTPEDERSVKETYLVNLNTWYDYPDYAPWYNARKSIVQVEFADTIYPKSTSCWFFECENLREFVNIQNLNTSNVTNMYRMFSECVSLVTIDVSGFDTSNVADMGHMFDGCTNLTTIYAYDRFATGKLRDSYYSEGMFYDCISLVGGHGTTYDRWGAVYARIDNPPDEPGYFTYKTVPLPTPTPRPVDMDNVYAIVYNDGTMVFQHGTILEHHRTMRYIFPVDLAGYTYDESYTSGSPVPWYYASGRITQIIFADKIQPESTAYWFYGFERLEEIVNINNLDTSKVTDMNHMFYCCPVLQELDVSNFNTSKVTDMSWMFACSPYYGENHLRSVNVSSFDTSNVTDMSCMFLFCENFTELDVSNFNTSNVTDMSEMFFCCNNLTALDVSNFNTSNVVNMSEMFSGCSNLTMLNISGFNTSCVADMSYMFASCESLTELDVSGFHTSNLITTQGMFQNCSNLASLDVSGFETYNVVDMGCMFEGCSSLIMLDVSGFDTSKVTNYYPYEVIHDYDMESMFSGCSSLTTIYASESFVIDLELRSDDMFNECTSLIGGNGTRYNEIYTDSTYARIDTPEMPGYFTYRPVSTFSWRSIPTSENGELITVANLEQLTTITVPIRYSNLEE